MSKILGGAVACAMMLMSANALAANWGPLQDDGCHGTGLRQFSSVLWNIPVGSNWEAACAATSHMEWGPPTRCVNQNGIKMWGQWDRSDGACH
jgi:hypothetical protein